MPATDLALLLAACGLSSADAERVAVMPLGYVLGYLAGEWLIQIERAPWPPSQAPWRVASPAEWRDWHLRVAVVTQAVRLVQAEYHRTAAEKGEQ